MNSISIKWAEIINDDEFENCMQFLSCNLVVLTNCAVKKYKKALASIIEKVFEFLLALKIERKV